MQLLKDRLAEKHGDLSITTWTVNPQSADTDATAQQVRAMQWPAGRTMASHSIAAATLRDVSQSGKVVVKWARD